MIIIIALFVIVIGALIAIVRSEKPVKLILAEARYDLVYNAMGMRYLYSEIIHRSQNKTNLIKKTGKIALITGGTRGIGVEVIRMLLQCDMNVIMGCRKPAAGEELLIKLRSEGVTTGDLQVYELDTSSLRSVRMFSKIINENYSHIHYLINAAGIMYVPYSESEDGFESHFATNYLGHYLLTHLLLPLVRRGGTAKEHSRIINISSCAYLTGDVDFADINKKDFYIPFKAYSQSKLAQILFSNYLNKILKQTCEFVEVYSVHPGIVDTGLFDGTHVKTMFSRIIPHIFKGAKEGAIPILHICLSADLEGKGGSYLNNCRIEELNSTASDEALQKKLFDYTKTIVNIKNFGRD